MKFIEPVYFQVACLDWGGSVVAQRVGLIWFKSLVFSQV